jgi:hypothetical protein
MTLFMRGHPMARSCRLVVLAVLVGAFAAGCATSEAGAPSATGDDGPVADSPSPGQDSTTAQQDSSSGSDATSGADTTVGDDSGSTPQDGGAMIDTADAPDETGSLADAAAPDSAAPTDSASMDALGDSNGGQDVSSSDATDASMDASEAGADAGDGRSDANDAASDASDAGPDASDARSDASDAAADAGPKCVSNVLTPTAAVSLSVNGVGNVAHNAIDGIFTTRWESIHAVDPQWIYLDFGAPVFIDQVQIAWETACATNYDIQVSNDAAVWTTLTSIVGNTQGGPAPADWTTAANHAGLSGVGRYLRINGTVRCTMYGYSIWEMRAFGDTNSTCHP